MEAHQEDPDREGLAERLRSLSAVRQILLLFCARVCVFWPWLCEPLGALNTLSPLAFYKLFTLRNRLG